MRIFKHFISLFYPKVCASCGINLDDDEDIICLTCFYSLPETNFHLLKDNSLSKLFWGRFEFENATAYFYYSKKGMVQKLLHRLKYRGYKEIGVYLGREYGKILKKCDLYKTVDLIIPVPLHRNKERKRGYNQSKFFAIGLSETMGIPYNFEVLYRISHTESQTGKKRSERWDNVKDKFISKNAEQLRGHHVLLVDDVITTGATIEASAKALALIPDVKISIAVIGFAGI